MKYLVSALIILGLFSSAQARQMSPGLHPMCNVTMPCEIPVAASVLREAQRVARGKYVARSMGIGGVTPRKTARFVPTPVQHVEHGVVRAASGAVARVASHAAGAFQCLVTALERQGYPVRFMGGWRARGSVRGSLHPAGLALDVNQVARNITKPAMPANEISLANACGLVSGAQWANSDSGHFQLGGWTGRRRYAMQ